MNRAEDEHIIKLDTLQICVATCVATGHCRTIIVEIIDSFEFSVPRGSLWRSQGNKGSSRAFLKLVQLMTVIAGNISAFSICCN
jgi:hypothetical protein